MKKLVLILAVIAFCLFHLNLNAQEKVKEKVLLGNWKLIIDIETELNEAEEEMEENDESVIGQVVLKSVSGLVSGIIDELDIYMEFRPGGELKVTVDAFGEHETEYSKWYISKEGRLFIEDNDSFSTEEFWMYDNGMLVNYQENGRDLERNSVYLVNIDNE